MKKILSCLLLMQLLACAPNRYVAAYRKISAERFADGKATREKIAKGIRWYAWLGYDQTLQSNQSINVVDIDLRKAPVRFRFGWFNAPGQRNTIGFVADTMGAVAAINSGYFENLKDGGHVSFHKSNGKPDQTITVPPGHVRHWKHQGAFVQTGEKSFRIIKGDKAAYESLPEANAVSSAPVLILNGEPEGKFFVKNKNLDTTGVERENPERHQGGKGARVAYALTSDNHLLWIAVDGRAKEAAGINAEQLTDFISRYYPATDAINMDGGGSVTLWLRGKTPTGVVNYPSDDRKFDHLGQRKVGMGLFLVPAKESVRKRMKKMKAAPDPDVKDYRD